MTPCCYWYHQTCGFERENLSLQTSSHSHWEFVPIPVITVHSLNEDRSKAEIWIIIHFGKRFPGLGEITVHRKGCSAPILDTHWERRQICSCLHRICFQVPGNTNSSHQTEYFNSPLCVVFTKSTASFRSTNTALVWAAQSQSTKHSPDTEPRFPNFRGYLPHCPEKSADFLIPFSPQPILNHARFQCFPEDLHQPSTSPHHL